MKPPDGRIRFHLDENVAAALAVALRLRDMDVTKTNNARLAGASDRHARRRLLATPGGADHAGIVFCLTDPQNLGKLVRGLALIHEVLVPEEMRSRVEYL